MVLIFIAISCKDEVKSVVKHDTDPEVTPTVLTNEVTTLVSDSGVTKYRITAEQWSIFDESKKPNWKFPKGLSLEQFDSTLTVEATFQCDSAIFWKNDKLWKFSGNVRVWNIRKELILTNEMYWDQRDKKVYSDSFIHIERAEQIIEGYGFESNERLTTYTLNKPMGIFPIDEEKMSSRRGADSLSTEEPQKIEK